MKKIFLAVFCWIFGSIVIGAIMACLKLIGLIPGELGNALCFLFGMAWLCICFLMYDREK